MDTLSLVFSLLVALLFGVLIGWWFARSGKKELQDRTQQLDAELRDSSKQVDALRTELQLQHDDYEAKLKTVQVDISKRSADIDGERARITGTVGEYESRVKDLQSQLDAERARVVELEGSYTTRLQTMDENLNARMAELDYERQRGVELQTQVDGLSAELATERMRMADAVKVGVYDTNDTVADDVKIGVYDTETVISETAVVTEEAAADASGSGNGRAALLGAAVLTATDAEVEVEVDDLTRINGIGPRFAAVLASAGITTYRDLAKADPAELRNIVGVKSWQSIDTAAWVAEAARFEQQPRLKTAGDDLIRIEGIGPRYNSLLRASGITSFAQLAQTDETVLADIIKAKAWQKVNYAEWKEQAALAATGDWAAFDELQARLNQRQAGDLALIQGVGDSAAAALRAGGIDSFAALAAATPEQVNAALQKGGVRGGNAAAWIAEARLRAKGKRVQRQRSTRSGQGVKIVEVSCPQDLALVDGIGTIYEEKLFEAGIGSFWELAGIPDEELVQILDLKRFQDVDLAAIKADAMRLANETNSAGRVWDGTPPDDFEILEGIGQIYERRLYSAGICSYASLAAATPERLAEICKAPAFHRPDYAFWIAQARQMVATA
jgi:predicted flap endonuclease-1-like 5' DNA nuclease